MNIEYITSRGLVLTEDVKKYTNKKLERVINIFHDHTILEIRVVFKKYSDYSKVEITIPAKGTTMRAEVNHKDLKAAVDLAVDKLVSQIRKYKGKFDNKLERTGIKGAFKEELDKTDVEVEIMKQNVVRNKQVDLKPMTVEEAITEMEMLGHDFYVFLDIKTKNTHVVYLRADGDYAVIETKITEE